jgi:hypothetical protein
MTGAIALYERLGYRRAPEFDFDMAARFGQSGAAPITSIAYLRHLNPPSPRSARLIGGSSSSHTNLASHSWRI